MKSLADLPPHIAKALKAETAGERIDWTGRPNARRTFLSTLPIWLFGIPWTAFSLFMFAMMLSGPISGTPPPDSLGVVGTAGVAALGLFMVPFIAGGFGMFGMPWWAWKKAKQTVYAITDKRLLILTEGRSRKAQSVEAHAMQMFTRTEKRDGTGSLKITLGFKKDSDGDTMEKHETLNYVAHVRRAEQLLQALRDRAKV